MSVRSSPRVYDGGNVLQIAMPMGGIGAGSISLSGFGALQDFAIRQRPHFSALPDGHGRSEAAFAVLRLGGRTARPRLLEGPFPLGRVYDQGLMAQGYRKGGHEGWPRFRKCRFTSRFPFGQVDLWHPEVPVDVCVTGWSPFVPLDDLVSSLPCAILEYRLGNDTKKPVEFEFSFHLEHLATGRTRGLAGTRSAAIPGGVFYWNTESPSDESFGSACLLAIGHEPEVKAMWLRNPAWTYGSLSALWRELLHGTFHPNEGNRDRDLDGVNGGSILVRGRLPPRSSATIPVIVAWHFPNVELRVGLRESASCCPPGADCKTPSGPAWRPFYAGRFRDARDVAEYVSKNYASLRERTEAFRRALEASSVPEAVLDAAGSNLAILKSPTVLRQENGNLWGWEGCFTDSGCCAGSCTHVWNYAQAIPHLFPALERTLREQELLRSMDERGHVTFRAALPDGPTDHGFHAAADGQLGGILKLFRDYEICGDRAWLAELYPRAKRSLEFSIAAWDPDRRGALFEPHHNTYDIEFWGPNGMCTSIYVGALSAMAMLAREIGDESDAVEYAALAERGARFMDEELFNGEYYEQKVMYRELHDQSFVRKIQSTDREWDEGLQLQRREGPNYQYGSGCLSDGVIGAWMARIYGVGTPLNPKHVRSSLRAIYRNNFRKDLSEHACLQRPGYAMGREAGLLLCSWPRGNKPTLPFIYSDEVWTGIEYQVASHLFEEGLVEDGENIVKAARKRYDGRTRNPFNEYECGSFYARAMSSWALLGSYLGLRYSRAKRTLWFLPRGRGRFKGRPRGLLVTAGGWGEIRRDERGISVRLQEGSLAVDRVVYRRGARTLTVDVEFVVHAGSRVRLVEW